jgi:flagellar basal body rod protein FlgG
MDRSIFVALSGLRAGLEQLNRTSNNLANMNTSGFRRLRPVFTVVQPVRGSTRAFVASSLPRMDSTPGVVSRTGRSLDLAIEGKGFFVVRTPRGPRYTRQGDMMIDREGRLATKSGYVVLGDDGPIRPGRDDFSVDAAGNISAGGASVGRLKVVTFRKTTALRYEGGVYRAAPGTRPLPAKGPGTAVLQGFLEASNVSPVKEMAVMMDNLRAYQTQVKMVQTLDEMSRKAIEEVGRV